MSHKYFSSFYGAIGVTGREGRRIRRKYESDDQDEEEKGKENEEEKEKEEDRRKIKGENDEMKCDSFFFFSTTV